MLLGKVSAQDAELACALEHRVGEAAALLPLFDMRRELFLGESSNGLAELRVFFGERLKHGRTSFSGRQCPRPRRNDSYTNFSAPQLLPPAEARKAAVLGGALAAISPPNPPRREGGDSGRLLAACGDTG